MPITEAQARRAVRHADIPWNQEVDDPREDAWVVHGHHGLLGGLAAAFSTGCRSLRRAEDFLADLGRGARRALGLGRATPCDTTLYRLLAAQSPAGLEETVVAQVKDLIARKVVRNDRLALGVMTFCRFSHMFVTHRHLLAGLVDRPADDRGGRERQARDAPVPAALLLAQAGQEHRGLGWSPRAGPQSGRSSLLGVGSGR